VTTTTPAAELLPILRIPTGTVTPYVLVVGDPERAQSIAGLLDDAREVGRFREYWSYQGSWREVPLTVTSHGVGGAGAAVAFEELIRGGAKTILRLGTCGALVPGIRSGDLIVATAAVREDGVSDKLLPPSFPAVADVDVTVALTEAAAAHRDVAFGRGVVITSAAFYPGALPSQMETWQQAHVVGIEMELATLLVIAALRGVRAGGVFTVDGNPHEDEASIYEYNPHRPVVDEGKQRMIEVGLDAVTRLAAADRDREGRGGAQG
jgi:uridine phosphorylase